MIYNNGIPKNDKSVRRCNKSKSKFRTRYWVEINDESKGRYDNTNFRFKPTSIRSGLCDLSDAYTLVNGTIKN